jgi:hypothetical protein
MLEQNAKGLASHVAGRSIDAYADTMGLFAHFMVVL